MRRTLMYALRAAAKHQDDSVIVHGHIRNADMLREFANPAFLSLMTRRIMRRSCARRSRARGIGAMWPTTWPRPSERLEQKRYDVVVTDLMMEGRRDGLEVLQAGTRAAAAAAGDPGDGSRRGEDLQGGDAARSLRLHREAARPGRFPGPGQPGGRTRRAAEAEPAARTAIAGAARHAGVRRDHRHQPGDAAGDPDRPAGGADRYPRADPRRKRHRQGTGRPRHPQPQPASQAAAGGPELRRPQRKHPGR